MKFKNALAAVILCCLTCGSALGQENLWTGVNESEIPVTGVRQIIPQRYMSFSLEYSEMKARLLNAPNERAVKLSVSDCIVSLPTPDGMMQRFRVVESPVMAPELSASFPDIRTFSLRGVDDKYASGKLDFNEFGFHAMVLTPEGDFFIDPYMSGSTRYYIVYRTADFHKDPAHMLPEEGVLGKSEEKPQGSGQRPMGSTGPAPAPCVGSQLRTYRLAVACTGEYAKAATLSATPTIAQTLARVVTTVNRVDGVYEKEVAIRLTLVPSTTLVLYTDPATDPFTGNANNNASTLINLSQSVITSSIGTFNFDIGHTFSTGAGGLAFLSCVCNANNKARGVTGSPNPVGDPYDIDYVAHEVGHQFGGNHTFNAITVNCNGNRNQFTAVEPGSGVTIMGYAGICGTNNIINNSIPYFHAISYDEIIGFTQSSGGSSCATISNTGNQPPVVTGSGNYTIPKSTPFILSGSGSDPDGDPITFSWEETDEGTSGDNWNSGNVPYFRSYAPVTAPTRLFPNQNVVISGNYTGTRGEYLPSSAQTLEFRLTARDNRMGGGGVCHAIDYITLDESGPFTVTYPTATSIYWLMGSQKTITWDVNGTNGAPVLCDSVRILISYNQGNTYTVLAASVPNDGFYLTTVPTLSNTISTCRIKIECKNNIFYDISNNNFTISDDPTIGIRDYGKTSFRMNVQPNPFSGRFMVSADGLAEGAELILVVRDLTGRIILQEKTVSSSRYMEEFELMEAAPGVYVLEVRCQGEQYIQKLILDADR